MSDPVHQPWRLSFVRRLSRRKKATYGIFLGLILVVTALGWVRPDRMLVEEVRFEGHERAREDGLRHLVGIRNGTRIWGVDLERAVRGAELHPWVRRATASRAWPSTVVVQVEEYEPVALLHADRLEYLDASGEPFLAAQPGDLDYPILSGIRADFAELHPDLPRLVIRDGLELLTLLEGTGGVPTDRVSEVRFSPTRGFSVQLRGGARLLFGLEQHAKQAARLAALQSEGLDPRERLLVDLAPASVAIVRPLDPEPTDG